MRSFTISRRLRFFMARSWCATCLAKSSFSSDTDWFLVPIACTTSRITATRPSSCSGSCRFLLRFPCRPSGNAWTLSSAGAGLTVSTATADDLLPDATDAVAGRLLPDPTAGRLLTDVMVGSGVVTGGGVRGGVMRGGVSGIESWLSDATGRVAGRLSSPLFCERSCWLWM